MRQRILGLGVLSISCVCLSCTSPQPSEGPSEPSGRLEQALNSTTIWGNPSGSQTITQLSGTTLTVSGALVSSGTFAAKSIAGVRNVDQMAVSGNGSSGMPWSGWETALNNLPAGVEIYFPSGWYTQSTTITTKAGWTIRGAGDGSSIISTAASFAGDSLQSISPYNSSTGVRLLISDLQFLNGNPASLGAAIDIVGGSFVNVKRVQTGNFKYGIVLDQAEVVDVEECDFEGSKAAGVWLVNNTEHQDQHISGVPTAPAASASFTNRIGIRKSQFNGIAIGIMDDGGYTHVFDDNNFNGGTTGIYLAGVVVGRVTGSEFESQSSPPIVSTYVTAQAGRTGPGQNVNVRFADNSIASGANPAIQFVSGSPITLENNLVASSAPAFAGLSNIAQLTAFGNSQSGTGMGTGALYDSNPTVSLVSSGGNLGVQTALPTTELEVNGGVRLNTGKAQPACTAAARGEFWFTQGGAGVKDSAQVCAKDAAGGFAWRTVY